MSWQHSKRNKATGKLRTSKGSELMVGYLTEFGRAPLKSVFSKPAQIVPTTRRQKYRIGEIEFVSPRSPWR